MQICDRCKKTAQTLIMSFFNTQMVCDECKSTERAHPDYKRAHDTETEAVLRGNYNFPGIGLPEDLVLKYQDASEANNEESGKYK